MLKKQKQDVCLKSHGEYFKLGEIQKNRQLCLSTSIPTPTKSRGKPGVSTIFVKPDLRLKSTHV